LSVDEEPKEVENSHLLPNRTKILCMQTDILSKLHATQHCYELFDRTQRSHEVRAATKTPTEILSERESER
jgi:hypothetical protein